MLTRKDVNRMYTKVLRVGYGDLQYLLREFKKIGYNSGLYGWNWDAYEIDNDTCIVTGYRNLTGERLDDKIIDKFNQLSKEIYNIISWAEREEAYKKLIEEFKEELNK